jgi:hypothetical protein
MFSARILKGGALLDESRILVEHWDPGVAPEANLFRLLEDNGLAKRSRMRAHDVLYTVLRPRFVEPGPHVIPALRQLVGHPRAFSEACYFEASRADSLLGAFAESPLWNWFQAGRVGVTLEETVSWLDALIAGELLPTWSDQVRTRAAQGLLATTRDFGVLRGAVRKELAPPRLSPAGFAYVAFRMHEEGITARGLAESHVWRRWLLGPGEVAQLLAEVAHLGVLRHSRAGSVVRVDWEKANLLEVARAVA